MFSRKRGSDDAKPRARAILNFVGYLLALGLLGYALWFYFTYRIGVVPSASMAPTLQPGDQYLINIRAYRRRPPRRGDVIVFKGPSGDLLVKRVVAVAGDAVAVYAGRVYLNGVLIHEPYVDWSKPPVIEWPTQMVVPQGHVFVLGDNRSHSEDSRDFGPVPLDKIFGRAERIIFPKTRRGPIRGWK